MAFQSVPNTFEVVLHYTCNSLELVNTFYFETLANYTLLDLSEATEAMFDWWVANVADGMPIAFFLHTATARGLEFQNDIEYTYAPGNQFGTVGSNPCPSNVAFAISRRSGLTGRSARGRVFIGPMAVGSLQADENLVQAVWSQGMVDALNLIKTLPRILAQNLEEVIVSRYTNNAPRPVGITFPVVTYLATDLRVDSQRGRLR